MLFRLAFSLGFSFANVILLVVKMSSCGMNDVRFLKYNVLFV